MKINMRRKNKLKPLDVLKIRALHEYGLLSTQIAELMEIKPGTVYPIISGAYWQDVQLPYIMLTIRVPDRVRKGWLVPTPSFRTQKLSTICTGTCLNCGDLVVDGVDEGYIYRVVDDTFICSEICESELIEKE